MFLGGFRETLGNWGFLYNSLKVARYIDYCRRVMAPGEYGFSGRLEMRKKWILIALSVGLLAVGITGGAALAWGGGGGWGGFGGWFDDRGRGEHRTAVANRVAEILGTDAQETADAIVRAEKEVIQEAAAAELQEFAGRIAVTLGTDAEATAAAIAQVRGEMGREALDRKLQWGVDQGRITEEEAQEIRDEAEAGGWIGMGFGLHHGGKGHRGGDGYQEFADRVGAILGVDGDSVSAAVEQAFRDELVSELQAAVESGKITQEKADAILAKIESGDWDGFGKGHRDGRRGR